jgi:hypothetical protein
LTSFTTVRKSCPCCLVSTASHCPDADLGPHAKNLLLRALIREGYLKGKTR